MLFFWYFLYLFGLKINYIKVKLHGKKKKIKSYALLSKKIKNKIKAMLNIYIYICKDSIYDPSPKYVGCWPGKP